MSQNFSEPYRSPRTLSLLAIGFLAALLAIDALFVILSGGQLLFPFDLDLDGEPMPFWILPIGLLSILEFVVFIGCVVFFLLWLYRCYKNLAALKSGSPEYTPGWAIGWWFIPFANLIKPLGVVRDLWNESDPDFDPELNFLSNSVGTPALLGWWWVFWLLSNFSANITGRLSDVESAEGLRTLSIALIIASLFGIVAAALAILVVKNITKRQEARFSRMGDIQPQFAPPPPPQFG
ncbi:MAG TPA: DUF4328 domain-containing protein [Pyrinomonadaceae bacterium]